MKGNFTLDDRDLQVIRDAIRSELQDILPSIIRQSTSKEFLSIDDMVNDFGFTRRHLQYLRSHRKGELPFTKNGKKIRYKRSDVLAYLENNHYVRGRDNV
jgi:hypothetical protein